MSTQGSRRRFLKGAAAGAAVASIGAPAIAQAQQTTKWRCQSMWSASEPTYKAFEDFCARIKVRTNNRLEIQAFPAGAVIGVFETLDAVSAGVLEAQSSAPVYWTGKDAGLSVIGDLNFGYTHPWQAEAFFYHQGGLDMLREAYAKYNVYPVGVSWWGVEFARLEEADQDDRRLQGRQVPHAAGHVRRVITKLGASIIVIPGGEVYSALDKGVVDAADWAHRVDEPPHGLLRGRQVPGRRRPFDADPGIRGQHGRMAGAAGGHQGDRLQLRARMDLGPGPARRRRRHPRRRRRSRGKGGAFQSWDAAEIARIRGLAQKTWEDWSKKTPLGQESLRRADHLAEGHRRSRVNADANAGAAGEQPGRPFRHRASRACSPGSTASTTGSAPPGR